MVDKVVRLKQGGVIVAGMGAGSELGTEARSPRGRGSYNLESAAKLESVAKLESAAKLESVAKLERVAKVVRVRSWWSRHELCGFADIGSIRQSCISAGCQGPPSRQY